MTFSVALLISTFIVADVLPIWAKAEDTATIDDCPANLERDRFLRVFRDSCYEFVLDHEREWPTAEFECGHKGGHLVIIRDAATNEWIYNTLKVEFRFDDVVFIGLTDSASEGHWLWVDDSRAAYTNWASDQPGFAGALEDCVTMDASDGKWHDHYCEDVLFVQNDEAFICQYPIVKQAPVTTEESPLESTQ